MTTLLREPDRAAPARLNIAELRHPTEYSRLLLALTVSAITFGSVGILAYASGGVLGTALLVGVLALFAGAVWVGLQFARARLLGHSLRVTSESLPGIHDSLQAIREQLDYRRRVDVYVINKPTHPITVTSYLGTKIILLDGDLVGDLLNRGQHRELTFLLARAVGALKARHTHMTIVLVLLGALDALKFLNPFLFPYLRATVYSGDQIGRACCGATDPALTVTERLLVGRELEPAVVMRGVLVQAEVVRRRWLPRLVQLLASEPHLTNRYLNLLFYARRARPEDWQEATGALDAPTRERLGRLWERSPQRRPANRARASAATVLAIVVTLAALLACSQLARALPAAGEPEPWNPPVPTPTTTASSEDLLAHVPVAIRSSCTANPDATAGTLASVVCSSGTTPITYNQFASRDELDAALDATDSVYAAAGDDCTASRYDGPWSVAGSEVGRGLCYTDAAGTAWIVWSYSELLIGAETFDVTGDGAALYDVWSAAGPES